VSARQGLAFVLCLALCTPCFGEEPEQLPAGIQTILLLRTLTFERNLSSRAGMQATIALAYNPKDAGSEAEMQQMFEALSARAKVVKLWNLPVALVAIKVDAHGVDKALSGQISVLYVCAGLGDLLGRLSANARSRQILTVTGTEEYVKKGVSVGLVRRGDKAKLLINLPSVHAEGAEIDSSLLAITELIR
jgi:hypothetical protein